MEVNAVKQITIEKKNYTLVFVSIIMDQESMAMKMLLQWE